MSRVEGLLEQLVHQNEQVIERLGVIAHRIECLESHIDWSQKGSGVNVMIEALDSIDQSVQGVAHTIEINGMR